MSKFGVGESPFLSFEPKPHWELGPKPVDFDRGRKSAVPGLPLKGLVPRQGPRQFHLDLHINEHGYTEIFRRF